MVVMIIYREALRQFPGIMMKYYKDSTLKPIYSKSRLSENIKKFEHDALKTFKSLITLAYLAVVENLRCEGAKPLRSETL